MKGLINEMQFTDFLRINGKSLSEKEKRIYSKLSEVEADDALKCISCSGEDCTCCSLYQDRQRWIPPEELFYNFRVF